MWTWQETVAISPEGIDAGWYCGNYNQVYIAAACAYPTNRWETFGEGNGVANPPLGATVTCSGSVSDMYGIDDESPAPVLDLLAYIIRWDLSANYSGLCDLYMTVIDVQNKDNEGGPPVPLPPNSNFLKTRIISGSDGKIKGYRLPVSGRSGGQVNAKNYFDLFAIKKGDFAHDLELPAEHAPMFRQNPQDALKKLKIDVRQGKPILHLA